MTPLQIILAIILVIIGGKALVGLFSSILAICITAYYGITHKLVRGSLSVMNITFILLLLAESVVVYICLYLFDRFVIPIF